MINDLSSSMQARSEMAAGNVSKSRSATVTSYDPANYCVKVMLQPDGKETGWIPIGSPWVGNNWGLFCPPSIGDVGQVDYREGGGDAGSFNARFYNDKDRAMACPSGEFWIVHKAGAFFKFLNDGSVLLESPTAISSTAPMWTHNGKMHVTEDITSDANITAGGEIADHGGAKTMSGMRTTYDSHHHDGSPPPDNKM